MEGLKCSKCYNGTKWLRTIYNEDETYSFVCENCYRLHKPIIGVKFDDTKKCGTLRIWETK